MKINMTAKGVTITHDKETVTHVLETRSDWRTAATMIKARLVQRKVRA